MTELQNLKIAALKIPDAEFCFQFGEEEPIVFAWSEGPMKNMLGTPHKFSFELEAVEGANITFTNGKQTFRIFARAISEASVEQRERQKQMLETQNPEENESN